MTYLMTLDEILTHLETTDCSTFQREALQEAVKQQQEITPALLAIIERAANDPANEPIRAALQRALTDFENRFQDKQPKQTR